MTSPLYSEPTADPLLTGYLNQLENRMGQILSIVPNLERACDRLNPRPPCDNEYETAGSPTPCVAVRLRLALQVMESVIERLTSIDNHLSITV